MTTQTLEQTLEDFRRQCESFAREQQPRWLLTAILLAFRPSIGKN